MCNDDLIIRVATPCDAAELLEIYKHYVTNTVITFEYDVPSVEEFSLRIENTLKKFPYFVAVLNGKIVGYCYAGVFKGRAAYDWACETTIYVKHDLHKCGIGKKLYATLESALKKMNILNMYACIAYPSGDEDEFLTKNSPDFHEHLGFKTVGRFNKCGYKFNRWYDMIWMEKFIGHHTENQKSVENFNVNC